MSELDMDRVNELYGGLFAKVDGAFSCVLGHLGDKLGLYVALAELGSATGAELAERTELHERWVLEWLKQQSAAGFLDHDDGRFSLCPEAAEILANEESGLFGAGMFDLVVGLIRATDGLENSFRTGIGAPYDSFGDLTSQGIERLFKPFYRTRLVTEVFDALDGVAQKLTAGAKVADVGCGAGAAVVEMAKVFPDSHFHGFDNSRVALARATRNVRVAGLANVTIHDASHRRLEEDGSYDLITTLDCIHDMTHPAASIAAIRSSLKPDGTWFVADVKGHGSHAENLERQPFSAMFYGFSVVCCMRAALSVEGGAGLGTMGFPEPVARQMAQEAGFSRFTSHDFENPLNSYYEIRP